MWELAVVYESGKRYFIPFAILEKFIDDETMEKIKSEALKELQRL